MNKEGQLVNMPNPNLYTLVTGASSGLGREISIHLSQKRKLILHGRSSTRLEETRQHCLVPEHHIIWTFDLKEIERLAESLSSLMSTMTAGIECLIHCAGIVTVLPMRAVDVQTTRNIMDINFASAVEIISTLLKKRINRDNLRNILFISSIWSKYGARGHGLYCASKGALDSLMRALAVELAPIIRVNSVLPGAVKTPLAEQAFLDPEIVAKWKSDYVLGLGDPDDIANVVEFVVSEKAAWMTGQQIIVDGGRTANMSLK